MPHLEVMVRVGLAVREMEAVEVRVREGQVDWVTVALQPWNRKTARQMRH